MDEDPETPTQLRKMQPPWACGNGLSGLRCVCKGQERLSNVVGRKAYLYGDLHPWDKILK